MSERVYVCGKCAAIGTNQAGPPAHAPGCTVDEVDDGMLRTRTRAKMYRVVWVREEGHGDKAREVARGVLFPGPLTHTEACTCIRKTTVYAWRRLVIEEIQL